MALTPATARSRLARAGPGNSRGTRAQPRLQRGFHRHLPGRQLRGLAADPRQLAAFEELVKFLRQEVLPRRPDFLVHRELSGESTLCPGRLFPTARMHRLFG
ncbi:MAG: hypothetical protein M5U12_04070 [Verrucomicrobia bacterium]|nr:hypothetical protein [Verrucomicrobiota bacterium]